MKLRIRPDQVIALCEVDVLCMEPATRTFRLRFRGRRSRPICTCAVHLLAASERAASEGVQFIDCGPIAAAAVN